MKKQVNIQTTESGYKYLTIYEVRAHVIKKDENLTVDRYLSKKDADEYADLCRELSIYDRVWVREQMVWC